MSRDFTIDDLVAAMRLLMDASWASVTIPQVSYVNDNKSDIAPFRVVNIGNSKPVELIDFVGAFESQLNQAVKNLMPLV